MLEPKLRREAAKKLRWRKCLRGGDDIPDLFWNLLRAEGYVEDAENMDFDDEAVEYIVEKFCEVRDEAAWLVTGKALRPDREIAHSEDETREDEAEEVAAQLGGSGEERRRTFSQIAARMASEHPEVRSFRKDVLELDDRLLTHQQAGQLLEEQGWPDGKGPVLNDLRSLGKRLSKAYRWREYDAIWFVLTGYPPPVFPLSTVASITLSSHSYQPNTATIRVITEPWVSPEEVAEAYKHVRAQILAEGNHLVKAQRNLEALRFVEEQTGRDGGHRPDYAELWKLWNEGHPDQRFKEYKRFHEAVTRTKQAVIKPKYSFPKQNAYEKTPHQMWQEERDRRYFEEHRRRHGPLKPGDRKS